MFSYFVWKLNDWKDCILLGHGDEILLTKRYLFAVPTLLLTSRIICKQITFKDLIQIDLLINTCLPNLSGKYY